MNIKVISSGSCGNAYLVDDGCTCILLDAGVPIKELQKACNYQLSKIDSCLLTHSHGDHSKSVSKLAERGVTIFLHSDTLNELKLKGHRFKTVSSGDVFQIGSFVIKTFDLVHDVTNIGYLVASKRTREKMVYITDTAYCRYRFRDLNYIMVEANHDRDILKENFSKDRICGKLKDRVMETHMSIQVAVEFLKANNNPNLKRVYLLHLSDLNSNAEQFRKMAAAAIGTDIVVC